MDKDGKGGISYLLANGASTEITYCGGANYPAINTQDTSTAPGWCSILTGCWADVHGITDNGIEKSNEHLTMLTTLVQDKTIESSAFYVSWNGHFGGTETTYIQEKNYIEEKNLNVTFLDADDDKGTVANTLSDTSGADYSDFIFTILEDTDHGGYNTGHASVTLQERMTFIVKK